MTQKEPILQDNKDRFVIFPVKHHDIWDRYRNLVAYFWNPEDVDVLQDSAHWNEKLTADEKNIIKHFFTSFAVSEELFNPYLSQKFVNEVRYPEAQFFYGFQLTMENIHFETLSLLIDTYLPNEGRKKAFKAVKDHPSVQRKELWAQKWLQATSFAERLVASAIVKTLFCSGATSILSDLKHRALMQNLTFLTDLVLRDRIIQSDFAVHIHNNHLINKVPKGQIKEMILEAVEVERSFTSKDFPLGTSDLNMDLMDQQLEFAADQLLLKFRCEEEFGTQSPFESMDEQNAQERKVILEKRAGELRKSGGVEKDTDKANLKRKV